jgi:hypothetical protein
MQHLLVVVPLLALPAIGQRILHTQTLTPFTRVVQMAAAGDIDGDGKGDFVARIQDQSGPSTTYAVRIGSGATGATLHTLSPTLTANAFDVAGVGDVDNDGRADVAVVNGSLRIFSGSTGALLHTASAPPTEGYASVCGVGDFNGDGRPDYAGLTTNQSNQNLVRIVNGVNGQLLLALPPQPSNGMPTLRSLGDVTGDGKQDVAIATEAGSLYALRSDTGGVVWTVPTTGSDGSRTVATIDLDGDGRREALHHRPQQQVPGQPTGTLSVFGSDGSPRFVVRPVFGYDQALHAAPCSVGDLDQDGLADFVVSMHAAHGRVLAKSGLTGATLWALHGTLPVHLGTSLASLGDVDGDGFGDLVVGGFDAAAGEQGRWSIVSGRILADVQVQSGACGAGPFLPELGMTRPMLGQTVTIAAQQGPAGAPGILAFSLRPLYPAHLGASSCTAWFDLGAGTALALIPQPTWSLALPLPAVPQLAGFEIALQAFYAPTTGPLGYDLSNGIWARLGWQ